MTNGNPEPLRLQVLSQLRAAAGLSQEEAARRCGLTTANGRRTFAAWEQGKSRPRRSNQAALLVYLLRDLSLRHDLDRFDDIYAILMDEWEWPGLLDSERADFLRQAEQPYAPFEPPPSEAPEADEDATPGAVQSVQRQWRWYVGLGLAILAVVLYAFFPRPAQPPPLPAPPALPSATPSSMPNPTPTINAVENLGFESGLVPWYWVGADDCDFEVIADGQVAHERSHYLSLTRRSQACVSLRKELGTLPADADTIGVAVWVRSPAETPVEGELVIWTGRGPLEETGVVGKGSAAFLVDGAGWRCVEAELPYDPTVDRVGRVELYFAGQDAAYDIDGASIRFGSGSLCPPAPVRLVNASFESGEEVVGWTWLDEACDFSLVEDADVAVDGTRYLSVRRVANCNSLYQSLPFRPQFGETYAVRVWVRASGPQLLEGQLVIWASGAVGGKAQRKFVAGPTWQCVETALAVTDATTDGLRAEFFFDSPVSDARYFFDGADVTMGATAHCPPPELALVNGDFEDVQMTGWQIEPCSGEVHQADSPLAGDSALALRRDTPDCRSISQDVGLPLQTGDQVQSAVWLRSQDGAALNGRLALWAIGGAQAEDSGVQIAIEDGAWHCFETALTILHPNHNRVRWEFYLDSAAPVTYLLDNAQLGWKGEPLCPHTDVGLRTTRVFPRVSLYYPGGMIGIDAEVQNLDGADLPAGSQLTAWLSGSEDGPPIDAALVSRTAIAAIPAGSAGQRIYSEVELPRVLPAGDYYVVWQIHPPTGISDVDERNNRDSRPVGVGLCDPQNRYCDVTKDSWGAAEIERWFDLGVSQGCRSGTEPFLNRPFCPDQLLTRDVVPIFLLRHLRGGDYAPPEGQGLYADFSGGRANWAEEFVGSGVLLKSAGCPQGDGQPIFCPTQSVSRGELILYLAQTLEWELLPVVGDIYLDVRADTPINRAIETAARSGFLAEDDPYCPIRGDGQPFCPEGPARRAFAAVVMVRAFAAAPQYPIVE